MHVQLNCSACLYVRMFMALLAEQPERTLFTYEPRYEYKEMC